MLLLVMEKIKIHDYSKSSGVREMSETNLTLSKIIRPYESTEEVDPVVAAQIIGVKVYSPHFKFRHSSAIDNLKIIGQQGT